jgi:hypothetical protein
MVEGKGQAKDLGKMEFEFLRKMVGVLLRMTRPIWNTGRVVMLLDSGFCVLSSIVELEGVAWWGFDQEGELLAEVDLVQRNQSSFC